MNENNTNERNIASPARKREIVKTLIIIFLAAMLLLTFFSRTIMNRSLAEITTQAVSSGKLTERIRGSGIVEANQSYEVVIDGNRIIDKIHIKTGQEINAGDVLFTVVSPESTELAAAEDELAAMELDYQKALLTVPVDYSAENQAIKNAREDLDQAIQRRDEAYIREKNASQAYSQYVADKSSLDSLTALRDKLTATLQSIDSDDYSAAAPEYISDLPSLLANYLSAESEYKSAYEIYSQAVQSGGDAAAAISDAEAKEAARNTAKTVYDNAKSSVRSGLAEQLHSIEPQINNLRAKIADYENSSQTGGMSYEDCVADVQAKQRILEDLTIALASSQNTDNINGQLSDLDLGAKKTALDKQREKVASLRNSSSETEIKSKYGGVVSAINVQPDDITAADVPAAVIDIAEEGYTVKISVEGEKSKQVKPGASAEVVNNWSGNVKAVLTDIRNDTQSGSNNRILVFTLTGDVDSGTYIDLSIPCGSGTYDAIVPKSSVYQDKGGYFVLKVRQKNSPFGNRYYAEKEYVEVLASDETSSAVQGSISRGEYVITAASKPVSAGDQVRMK